MRLRGPSMLVYAPVHFYRHPQGLQCLKAACLMQSVLTWWALGVFPPIFGLPALHTPPLQRGECSSSLGANVELPGICCSGAKSLQPLGRQHVRLPCPSLSPGVCSNSLSRWWPGVGYIHCVCSWMLPNCPQKLPGLVYILTKTMWKYFFPHTLAKTLFLPRLRFFAAQITAVR